MPVSMRVLLWFLVHETSMFLAFLALLEWTGAVAAGPLLSGVHVLQRHDLSACGPQVDSNTPPPSCLILLSVMAEFMPIACAGGIWWMPMGPVALRICCS